MVREWEKKKEKITNDILNRDFNLTTKQLADSYLAVKKWKQTKPSNRDLSILGSIFTRRTFFEVFYEYLSGIEKACKQKNKPILEGNSELKTMLSVVLKTGLESSSDRLHEKTMKQLKDNYETPTIKKVLEAIIDFELPVMFSIMAKKTLCRFIKIANDKNTKTKEVLSNACGILLGGAPLSDHERETIRAIRQRLQVITIEMSPLKEVALLNCLFPLAPFPTPENKEADLMDWLNILPKEQKPDLEALAYMLQFNYKRKKVVQRIYFIRHYKKCFIPY